MEEGKKFILGVVTIIAITILIFTWILADSYTERMKHYIQSGYCETTASGVDGLVMQKCK